MPACRSSAAWTRSTAITASGVRGLDAVMATNCSTDGERLGDWLFAEAADHQVFDLRIRVDAVFRALSPPAPAASCRRTGLSGGGVAVEQVVCQLHEVAAPGELGQPRTRDLRGAVQRTG